jgi:glycosyltransferase involved in cell wall biosynthesis
MLSPPCRQVLLIRNSLFFSPFYLQTILPRQSWRSRGEFLLRRWLVLLSARSSDVVVTASRTMLDDVQRFLCLSDGRGVVNYFGVPLERFVPHTSTSSKAARENSNKPFRLLYVSTYSDYKNLTTLLKAVRILVDHQESCEVSLVTTADPWQFPEVEVVSREEDQALAAHPQIAPFVKFTGPIPYDDVPRLYQDADLFVFPSLAESFGHPLVEAMASGLPVLASDILICREICGEAALYFSPFDAQDLAEKILRLRKETHPRRQLGEVGRKRVEQNFDWNDHVRRLVELIEQVGANA